MKPEILKKPAFLPTDEYLLSLLRASINETPPAEKPEEVSWRELFRHARRQNVAALAFAAIQQLNVQPEGEELELWDTWCKKLLTKSLNQNIEIETVLTAFNEAGRRIMPLKGYYFRQMYPRPELREMSDFDLLVDDDRSEETKDFMQKLGYEFVVDNDCHAEYKKPPYIILELHKTLLTEDSGLRGYFMNPWENASSNPKLPCVKQMNLTETYLYIIAHFYKHYFYYGCTMRMLVDIWLFAKRYENELDWKEIEKKLKKQGSDKVAHAARALGETWFAANTYDAEQIEMAKRILNLGKNGRQNFYAIQISRYAGKKQNIARGKFQLMLRIFFPPRYEMKVKYPVLEKFGILLPLFWCVRGVRTVVKAPKHFKKYYNCIIKAKL